MSTSNGQTANQTTFNNSFMSRTSDTSTIGVVDLNNTSDANSGARITNQQRYTNEIADSDGTNGIGDASRKNYSSTNVVANGDSRKTAIGKIDAQFNSATSTKVVNSITSLGLGVGGDVILQATTGGGVKIAQDNPSKTFAFSFDGFSRGQLAQQTLVDNTSTPAVVSANTIALNVGRRYHYCITRGAGNVRVGSLYLINDGTNADIIDSPELNLGAVGVTFTTDIRNISGSDSQTLLYATTSTGTDAKLNIEFINFPKPT